ncbi:MAG: SOS response-associated peptidase family protein [Aquabacterium sp.]|nr:SOS response-associated peptidase family protein [Aquabacterium sp.]MDI1258286.1 SOS response-associated peptidase family protein [Aquabacterium sp.]
MCNQFRTLQQPHLFESHFGVSKPTGEWRDDVYPDYVAPIVRRPRGGRPGARESVLAKFGLVPAASKTGKRELSTMNARDDRVRTARSYKGPFRERQWCIIPAERFYEPLYDLDQWAAGSRRSERFAIQRFDQQPMGIAGIWEIWKRHPDDDDRVTSFSMLTINADIHPLLHRFHRPFDNQGKPEEKRTVVLLGEAEYDAWLDCSPGNAFDFFHSFAAEELVAASCPEPPRTKKPKVEESIEPNDSIGAVQQQLGLDFG